MSAVETITGKPNVATVNDVVIESLNITYTVENRSVEALRDINISVPKGQFVCILGPSGSGKTTLLNTLAGFIQATKGRITMAGKEVGDKNLRRGYVFQQYALLPWLTVLGNVRLALEQRGIPRVERDELALKFLAMVGLDQFAHLFPNRLSGGMQQRTSVARALAFDPPILLLDEPFAALDAFTREKLQSLVVELHQKSGKTFVYITHNIGEAVHLGDRIIVLSAHPGQVKADIPVTLEHPRNEADPAFAELVRQVHSLVEA